MKSIKNHYKAVVLISLLLTFTQFLISQTWLQKVKKVATGRSIGAEFGVRVRISGNYAVSSAFFDDLDADGLNPMADAGSVYILKKDQGGMDKWGVLKKIVAYDRAAGDNFGYSVFLQGNILIVGSVKDGEDAAGLNSFSGAGSVYIYYKDQGGPDNWGLIKKIVPGERAINDRFGADVALSGDVLIVGADKNDYDYAGINYRLDAGCAFIFYRNQGGADNWGQVAKLSSIDRESTDFLGLKVAVYGDYAIATAFAEDHDADSLNAMNNSGSAYVFYRNKNGADKWGQIKKITSSVRQTDGRFGVTASMSGDYAAIGAYGDESNAGAAYLFKKDQGGTDNWGLVKRLIAADRAPNDYFGNIVEISGDYAFITAYGEDEDANGLNTVSEGGSCYMFYKNEGGTDNWGQFQKVVPLDRTPNKRFGISCAINGYKAIVGADFEDLDENGMNSMNKAGAIYVYNLNAQSINIQFSSITKTSFKCTWMSGTHENRCVFVKQASSGSASPSDSNTYLADTVFGLGAQIGTTGWYCVYNGSGNNVTVTGLTLGTDYTVMVCDYDGIAGAEKYLKQVLSDNPRTVQTDKNAQTITFAGLSSKVWGDADFDISATSSSGLAVVFSSSNTSVATVSNGKVHIVSAGNCQIYADQSGDALYSAAPRVIQALSVSKKELNLIAHDTTVVYGSGTPSFRTLSVGLVNGDKIAVTAYTFKSDTNIGSCPLIIKTYSFTTGTEFNYNVTKVNGTYTIKKRDVTIKADNFIRSYGEFNPALTYSMDYKVITQSINIHTNATNTSDAGVYDIIVSNAVILGARDTNLNIIYQKGTLTINKADQFIIFLSMPEQRVGDPDLDPGAYVLSGLPVSYICSDTTIASIIANKIHFKKPGKVNIIAHQAGNKNFNAAPDTIQPLTIKNGISINTIVNNVEVYPNPASNYVVLENSSLLPMNVSVINMTGMVMLQKHSQSDKMVIDISDLTAGIYIIRIETEEGITIKELMVK